MNKKTNMVQLDNQILMKKQQQQKVVQKKTIRQSFFDRSQQKRQKNRQRRSRNRQRRSRNRPDSNSSRSGSSSERKQKLVQQALKTPSYFYQPKKVIFAQESVTLDKLKASIIRVQVLQNIPFILVLDTFDKFYQNTMWRQWVTQNKKPTWNLQALNISETQIQTIEVKHELKYLNLQYNVLRSLNLFKCDTLLYLDVSHNKINSLENFNFFPRLQGLDISKNQLLSIKEINAFTQLKELRAIENKINQIDMKQLPNLLQKLDLSKNKISKIEGREKQENLTVLNLSFNKIEQTGFENTFMPNLTEINIKNNNLKCLNLNPKNFNKLISIFASFNLPLTQVYISEVTTLKQIKLDHCRLSQIIVSNQNLINLDLSQNILEQIIFQKHLPHLKTLNLNCNLLKQLDLTPACPLQNLNILELSFNNLTKVSYALPLPRLTKINLLRNIPQIKFIPPLKKQSFLKLEELNVGDQQITINRNYAMWLLRTIPEHKHEEFISYVRKEYPQSKMNSEFFKTVDSWIEKYARYQLDEFVFRYLGIEEKVKKPKKNLVEEDNNEEEYTID